MTARSRTHAQFALGRTWALDSFCSVTGAPGLMLTLTTTDMPGLSRDCSATAAGTRMRTGKRCTILVKLPVALSGGSNEKTEPDAGATLATRPSSLRSGNASMAMATGCPGTSFESCVSLNVRTAHDVRRGWNCRRGAARYRPRAAAARSQPRARYDSTNPHLAPAPGVSRSPRRRSRSDRRSPCAAKLSGGAPSRDPRDRHQSAAGRRQRRDRARRSCESSRCGSRAARADGDQAVSLAVGSRHDGRSDWRAAYSPYPPRG